MKKLHDNHSYQMKESEVVNLVKKAKERQGFFMIRDRSGKDKRRKGLDLAMEKPIKRFKKRTYFLCQAKGGQKPETKSDNRANYFHMLIGEIFKDIVEPHFIIESSSIKTNVEYAIAMPYNDYKNIVVTQLSQFVFEKIFLKNNISIILVKRDGTIFYIKKEDLIKKTMDSHFNGQK
ncbi:MAG: hypothetical protein ACOC56_02770 [Atribacterota bacterium]